MSLLKFVNPTGKPIRIDQAGSGRFKVPRGERLHKGVDFLCTPGQVILSPINGRVIRVAYPYSGDKKYKGVLIGDGNFQVKMFYLEPHRYLIGHVVLAGAEIGVAQDISQRYKGTGGTGMEPHIHCQLALRPERAIMDNNNLYLDPEVFL
ncbi:MAG: hypothetical protein ACYTKD_31520 [Planctomycetota bacterium]|jgi:hypothetical protein